MSTTNMTQLGAVNIALASVGQSPVSSLTAPLTGTVAMAKNILDEVRREVLADGWMFNSDYEKPHQPDAVTSEITFAESVLRVDGSAGKNSSLDLTQRLGKLYDRKNRVYTFTSTVYLDVIYNMEFTDIPDVARNYIAKRAARILVERTFGDATQSNIHRQEEFEALVKLRKHESSVGDYNYIKGSTFITKMLNRRSPFNY